MAEASRFDRPAQLVDELGVRVHGAQCKLFFAAVTSGFQWLPHHARMPRDFTSAAQRVAWAIARSGRTKTDLAAAIGCTHATLSQWAGGTTDIGNARVGLLVAFADEVGVNLGWLLTGDGPAVSSFSAAPPPLVVLAQELSADEAQAAVAERLLRALRPTQT